MELEGQALGSEAQPWAWLVPDASGSQSGLALLMDPRGMSPLYLLGQGGLGSPWGAGIPAGVSPQSGRKMAHGFMSQAGSQIVASPFLPLPCPAAMTGGV